MDEKKTFKQEVKEWWDENGRVIKTGLVCGFIGFSYGFIKATMTLSDMMLKGDISVVRPESPDYDSDDFEYTEDNVDDPQLLELIRIENENS